jgi:hypothetical protein
MACIALAEWRQTRKVYPGDEIVKRMLSESDAFKNEQEASKALEEMLDKGSRYKNIEKHIGAGAAFALGTKLAET